MQFLCLPTLPQPNKKSFLIKETAFQFLKLLPIFLPEKVQSIFSFSLLLHSLIHSIVIYSAEVGSQCSQVASSALTKQAKTEKPQCHCSLSGSKSQTLKGPCKAAYGMNSGGNTAPVLTCLGRNCYNLSISVSHSQEQLRKVSEKVHCLSHKIRELWCKA